MHFGDTLQAAIYPPWKDHYIDYAKLKHLLRETDDGSDAEADSTSSKKDQKGSEEERGWTEHDESTFVHELINVQLEKVHDFQVQMAKTLKDRAAAVEARLEKLVPEEEEATTPDKGKEKDGSSGTEETELKPETTKLSDEEVQAELKDALKELDDITSLINQVQKFSRINFTGFFKAAKKHDRRTRGELVKAKGKKRAKEEGGLMVRPLLQVRLGALEFNKEDYDPLLYRLSGMYAFISQMNDTESDTASNQGKLGTSAQPSSTGKYSSYKFWIHPDNYLEVKTAIVRRLPMLIYNPNHAKQIDVHLGDPTINSLYFDNPKFGLYTDKVEKKPGATSLRLRWYGHLSDKPEIYLERKTMQSTSITNAIAEGLNIGSSGNSDDFEGAIEERIVLKEKYVESFIKGEYSMEKTINRMKDRKDKTEEDVKKYDGLVKDIQALIKEQNLQPMLRAVYTRTAFQIPGDDRIRVSLDTNLALIREDALDSERPCRDPEDWHRKDIDDTQIEFPFSSIRKGEINRFPYALLEIKVRDTLPPRARQWINELMNSHLVREAPRFSKFVHGVSSLFEDYVNIFPFWLGEVDQDIRKDPKSAFKEEQEKKARQAAEQDLGVSLKLGGFGKFGTPPRSGFVHRPDRPESVKSLKMDDEPGAKKNGKTVEEAEDGASDSHSITTEESHDQQTGFLGLLPSFSTSRYGRRHRQKNDDVVLPPGVTKPDVLLMHSTPVNVEPKVWLANQRTFIKWEHISVLLATLSLGLYNAAGEKNNIARALGVAYTVIALFTGIWGYWIYIERCKLIRERSGKDFDKKLGPIVISIGLSVALLLNFGFKYYAAMEKNKHHGGNATEASDWFEVAGVSGLGPVETMVERILEDL